MQSAWSDDSLFDRRQWLKYGALLGSGCEDRDCESRSAARCAYCDGRRSGWQLGRVFIGELIVVAHYNCTSVGEYLKHAFVGSYDRRNHSHNACTELCS